MVATVPAGAAREAGRCATAQSSAVSWQAGTSFLYYIDSTRRRVMTQAHAVFRLDLESGARRQVTGKTDSIVPELHVSPDGKWLLYLRDEDFQNQAIVIRDLAGGKEKVLGKVAWTASETWTGSAAWTADSRTVLVSNSSGIGSEIIAYPVNGGPAYSMYSAPVNVRHLAAGTGGLLAVETDPSRENLARASLTPIAAPDVIDPANGFTWSPSFAPDGTLAFLSNRSGTNALWIQKPGAAPALLFDAGLCLAVPRGLLARRNETGGRHQFPKGVSIKILTADGASLASFTVPSVGIGTPTWTPDGKAVIVMDLTVFRPIRIEIADPGHRTPVAPPYWDGIAIRDNGTFSVRFDKPGIWQIDKGIRLISAKYPARFIPQLAFLGDDVLIPDFDAAGGAAHPGAAGRGWTRPGAGLCPRRPGPGRQLHEQDGGKPQDRRCHLCGGGLARHQYRPFDLGPALDPTQFPVSCKIPYDGAAAEFPVAGAVWRAKFSSVTGARTRPGRGCCTPSFAAEGVEAWYDAHIGPGQDWRIATAKALEASQIFVLLFSANAAQSSDIAKELAAAVLEKKLIIPVRLENIAPKGAFLYELASRNWVNAYDNTEAKLAELAKGLAHLVKTGARDESVLPFDAPAPARARQDRLRKPVLIAAAALALIAAPPPPGCYGRRRAWTVESSRPFISTLALEGEPAFSPDGKMLAYTSGADTLSRKIYVRNMAGGDGIKITERCL